MTFHRASQQFMDIFGVAFLVNGLVTVIVICIFSSKLLAGHLDGLTIGYGSSVLIEIFIFCYYGNELEVTTNGFVNDLYECDWIGKDAEKLKLLMTLHQQPITLKICDIYNVNLGFFLNVSF